jgi:toxin ParE1/3/4
MLPIIRSAQSEQDLVAIWSYIAKDSPTAATRLLERIDRRMKTLARYPLLGEHQPQFGENTRRIIEGKLPRFL